MIKSLLLLAFSVFLSSHIIAQSTAVMRVSVNIVSGVQAEKNSNLILSDNTTPSVPGKVTFKSTPHSDVFISTEQDCTLSNSNGKTIAFKTESLILSDYKSGQHTVSINGNNSEVHQTKSKYSGSITATISYL